MMLRRGVSKQFSASSSSVAAASKILVEFTKSAFATSSNLHAAKFTAINATKHSTITTISTNGSNKSNNNVPVFVQKQTTSQSLPQFKFFSQSRNIHNTRALHQPEHKTTASTEPEEVSAKREALISKIFKSNKTAQVVDAVDAYEELKNSGIKLRIHDFNRIIGSFAPRKIMWDNFKTLKDYVDMYRKTGDIRAQERLDEATEVFKDISRVGGLTPDVVSYNCFMKVQLTAGPLNVDAVFATWSQMQDAGVKSNIATFTNLIRACAILRRPEQALELYRAAVLNFAPELLTIHFHNTLLDAFAEDGHYYMHALYDNILAGSFRNPPPDGMTFNIYAKGLVMRGETERLMKLAEEMRVHGVLQRELSTPIRKEIYDAYRLHADVHGKKKDYSKSAQNVSDPKHVDPFADIREKLTIFSDEI